MVKSKIAGIGMYVPKTVFTNDDLKKYMDTNDEWIQERTGIKERRYAHRTEETTTTMGVEAAKIAIERAGITAQEIDFIIFATICPDYYFPGCGVLVQRAMQMKEIAALDVRNQCSGFVYALSVAEAGFPNGLKTTMWAMPVVRAYMPNARRTAELMQADLKRIGVEIEIVTVEWAEYLRRSQQGEHETVILGWNYAYADAGQILELGWSCEGARNGLNRSRWCNEDFDRAINRARVITDEAERAQLYRQAQRVFHEEAPALLIAYASKVGIARPEVENFKLVPAGPQPLYGVGLKR